MLRQKENLFHLNLPTTMQNLGIFGLKKDDFLYF
jgi:hypothetical protein